MTLLTLLVHVQLSILSRKKYVQSVINLANEERNREMMRESLSLLNMIWGADPMLNYSQDDIYSASSVQEETERKFLTLSWWLLHVGWKDVGERVRRAVEEAFDE
jgi:peroxin-3